VSHLAWRSQPPVEPARDLDGETPEEEEAEVVDLTEQRLLGWVKGMFGGAENRPPRDEP
jgi:hypothetical protein